MTEFEAKAAIRDVLSGYSGAAGRLDIDSFCSFFVEDAEVHGLAELLNLPGPLKGRKQIKQVFGATFENLEWLVQMNNITDVHLDPNGKSATTSTGLIENAKRKNAPQIMLIARYDDKLALTPEGWRFTERRLTVFRFGEVA